MACGSPCAHGRGLPALECLDPGHQPRRPAACVRLVLRRRAASWLPFRDGIRWGAHRPPGSGGGHHQLPAERVWLSVPPRNHQRGAGGTGQLRPPGPAVCRPLGSGKHRGLWRDPTNITIGGQSAGGGSVLAQLTSPQNEGLCQRAIIQSGLFAPLYPDNRRPPRGISLEDAERAGVEFFDYLGVSSLQEARDLDGEFIRQKALEYGRFWGTVVDGQFCVDDPFKLFVENKRLQVPVMAGHTSTEFINRPQVKTKDELKSLAQE